MGTRSSITSGTVATVLVLVAAVLVALGTPARSSAGLSPASDPASRRAPARSAPLTFVENRGQVGAGAAYYARMGSQTVWLAQSGIVFDVVRPARRGGGQERLVFSQRFVGASEPRALVARRRQPGAHNFLVGHDRARRAKGYREVRYRSAWEGIDVRLSGRDRTLKQDFLVRPGASTGRIRIAYRGVERLRIARDGALLIETAFGTLRESAPRIHQPIDGRRVPVQGAFRLLGRTSYTFELGRYRRRAPLVIDPSIAYAHYLGGSGSNAVLSPFQDAGPEVARDVAVDGAGNAYVTGVTRSRDFPGVDPSRTRYAGHGDAFVTKIDSAGALAFTTYLGSDSSDEAFGIAVDRAGNLYVTGQTTSSTAFGSPGAAQPRNGGFNVFGALIRDAYVTKLDPSGTRIVWSSYIGGKGDEQGNDVAVDAAGNAYVTGTTDSRNLRVANAPQPGPGGPADAVLDDVSQSEDAFVTQVSADGSRFVYSTYLGGSGDERGRGIALDQGGGAYVTGQTASRDLPTAGALQATRRGDSDAFVARIPAGGGRFAMSTYLGGSDDDGAFAVAVDRSGRPWLTGETGSRDLPVRNAAQPRIGDPDDFSGLDAFVAALAPGGASLSYGTYLGGAGGDQGLDVALDARGDAYVTGTTHSVEEPRRQRKGFPSKDAFQRRRGLSGDAFVTKIDGRSGKLSYSSPLGGSGEDSGLGIAADGAGNAHVVGGTVSPDFPGVRGRGRTGEQDGFIARIAPGGSAATPQAPFVYADVIGPDAIRAGRPAQYTVVVGNSGEADALGVPLWIDGIPSDATWSVDVDLLGPSGVSTADRALAERMPASLQHDGAQLIPLFLPLIPAGATGSITLTVTVPGDERFTLRSWADPPMVGTGAGAARAAQGRGRIREAVRECLTEVMKEALENFLQDLVPFECIVGIEDLVSTFGEREVDRFFNDLDGQPGVYGNQRLIVLVMKAAAACISDLTDELLIEADLLKAVAEAVTDLADRAKLEEIAACKEAFTAGDGLPPTANTDGAAPAISLTVNSGRSFDPNDKASSRGHGRGRYLTGREPLRYSILFENLEQATLPAEQVVITDRLDPALDLDTVRFGRVAFGNRRAGPVAGASSLATDVDLRPERNLIVRIEGTLDRASRVVTWRLRALDPAGGPPADPLDGFLPPNTRPPAGQGSVSLFARAKRTVKTGARIRNRASIVFDDNAPIATPVRVNRIDRSAPASRVARAARRSAKRLRVRWGGRDRGSGIGRFTVLASENSGPFKVVRASTRARVGTFKAKRGRRYVFSTAAQDRAGNPEAVPMVGDLLTPALRARRRDSTVVVRTRFFVQRAGALTVRAPGRRGRSTSMLRGSRVGATVLRSARRVITARALGRGPVALRVRLRARSLGDRRAHVVLVRGGGMGGGTLRIPFRTP
jgi:hypothetical protein